MPFRVFWGALKIPGQTFSIILGCQRRGRPRLGCQESKLFDFYDFSNPSQDVPNEISLNKINNAFGILCV